MFFFYISHCVLHEKNDEKMIGPEASMLIWWRLFLLGIFFLVMWLQLSEWHTATIQHEHVQHFELWRNNAFPKAYIVVAERISGITTLHVVERASFFSEIHIALKPFDLFVRDVSATWVSRTDSIFASGLPRTLNFKFNFDKSRYVVNQVIESKCFVCLIFKTLHTFCMP